jgi:hypothetical protein
MAVVQSTIKSPDSKCEGVSHIIILAACYESDDQDLIKMNWYLGSNPGRQWRDEQLREVTAGWGSATSGDEPELRSGRYGAQRLGFSNSKRSGRQGDPYLEGP